MGLDILIPAHNDEARIGPVLEAYRACFPDPDTRFVVVLDRCSDHTPDVVWAQREVDPRVEIVHHPKLRKGRLLLEAFHRCKAELVGFVEAGGTTAPSELLSLEEAALHADGSIAPGGAKVIRRDVVEQALPLIASRKRPFDTDLLVAARRMGRNIVEVPTAGEGSRLAAVGGGLRMAASTVRLWMARTS